MGYWNEKKIIKIKRKLKETKKKIVLLKLLLRKTMVKIFS